MLLNEFNYFKKHAIFEKKVGLLINEIEIVKSKSGQGYDQ